MYLSDLTYDINWNKQISHLYKVVNNKLYLLRKLRSILPSKALETVYLSCIQPVLDYCDTVWDVCGCNGVQKAQSLQNQAARIVTGNFDFINTRGEELVRSLKWQTLKDRRKFHLATLMYKCVNGLAPNYLCDQINLLSDINTYQTRSTNSLDVLMPAVNREIFKKSFAFNGALIWNSIPDFIRRSENVLQFKILYKRFYF